MRARKPTYEERKVLINNNLDTYTWMVQKSTSKFIQIVNKNTKEVKVLEKENASKI